MDVYYVASVVSVERYGLNRLLVSVFSHWGCKRVTCCFLREHLAVPIAILNMSGL